MSTSSTGTLSSAGIGSGLNVTSLVSQLMATQQQPLVNLQVKQATYQAQISAYGSLQSTLSTLQTDAQNLSAANLYSAYSTTASASGYFTSSANATASAGSYSLAVTNLAQTNKLASTDYASTTSAIGTGTLTFNFGTYNNGTTPPSFSTNAAQPSQSVTIGAANNSLTGISAAINAANIGVTSSISYDGSGYRLVLTSNNSGAANALQLGVSNAGNPGVGASLTDFAYDPTQAAPVGKMTQTVAAKDAAFTLDGMAMTSASNTVTGAIQGVSLTLAQPTPVSSPVTLTVAANTSLIQSAVQSFVTDYNAAQASIKSLTAYNATTKTASILTGDSTVQSVQTQLRAILNTPLSTAGGGLNNLADVGITFNKDGTLALNTATLASVLADPSKNVSTLFASVGVPTDPLVSFGAATAATQGGNYALNITRAATQGTLAGSSAPGLTITTGTNDSFNLNVNGIAAAVTLPAGTYTPTALAAQVQSQINGAAALSSAGVNVSVGYNGTQGSVAGSAAAGLTITAGVNDALSVMVDGAAVSVTLKPGATYTAASLAAEMQSEINAALPAGKSVAVSTSSGGVMTLSSDSYGAASSVNVTGGNGASNLLGAAPVTSAGTGTGTMLITSTQYGSASTVTAAEGDGGLSSLLGTPSSTPGLDVAGTIGGQAGVGIGQTLTATTGNAAGLTLTVNGSATGSRGTVAYASGIASQLATLLTNMTSSTGLIADRTNSLQTSITNIGTQTTQVNARLAAIQAQYQQQFSSLDTLMASMSQTSTFLTQQITSLQNNPIKI